MNSGLPSLLDAIFGKEDLASVSLAELHEVISEFPSFNAAHFFLSKKLGQENDASYEKESMRTALYFNNPLWLQSLLEEENHKGVTQKTEPVAANETNSIPVAMMEMVPEKMVEFSEETTNQPVEIVEADHRQEPETEAVSDVDSETDRADETVASPVEESGVFTGPVSSFDELMSKYKIDIPESDSENPVAFTSTEEAEDRDEQPFVALRFEKPADPAPLEKLDGGYESRSPDPEPVRVEIREEILNEYGIFEEVLVKETDHDLDAFDRPANGHSGNDESIPAEIPQTEILRAEADHSIPTEIPQSVADNLVAPDQKMENPFAETDYTIENREPAVSLSDADLPDEQYRVAEIAPLQSENIMEASQEIELPLVETDSIVENQMRGKSPEKSDEGDYDAFDRPAESPDPREKLMETAVFQEELADAMEAEADDTNSPESLSDEPGKGMEVQIQELVSRFGEKQKSKPLFEAKNAESIVFAPYHMIDYFASQGIKLVLEDHPADNLGKQLKSFTDWLKVMKKLPNQPVSENQNEKEADRIRHFAAHSIEERDILTESMAEVLAKQGMYENAIALFQKLSLIYPPKSAYFASRIEQLKASLP